MEIFSTPGIVPVKAAQGQPQGRVSGAAFRLPAEAAQAGRAAASSVAAASLEALLSLQEASVEPDAERNRRARSQARAILDTLRMLQHGLLLGGVDPGQITRLAQLARHLPEAADPGLREAVAAIAVRAEVELARLEMSCHIPSSHRTA